MKSFAFLILATLSLMGLESFAQPARENNVDLCKVDPGNSLNLVRESMIEIDRRESGFCEGGYGGNKTTITYRTTYFEVCTGRRYEKIERLVSCH